MSKERTEMIFEDINSLSLNFGEHVVTAYLVICRQLVIRFQCRINTV